jgi:hypothetical protein
MRKGASLRGLLVSRISSSLRWRKIKLNGKGKRGVVLKHGLLLKTGAVPKAVAPQVTVAAVRTKTTLGVLAMPKALQGATRSPYFPVVTELAGVRRVRFGKKTGK